MERVASMIHVPYGMLSTTAFKDFLSYPAKNSKVSENSFYADVINHCDHPNLGDGRITDAHETTHFINNDIRNAHSSAGKVNGFYIGNSLGIVVPEPNFSKSQVAQFIPSVLQGFRYSTYVVGQSEWNDRPLYLFDEWTAYINDSIVSIEDYMAKKTPVKPGSKYDGICGPVEFSIYALGVGMAIMKYDPTYWEQQESFKRFYRFLLGRSQSIYTVGKDIPIFMVSRFGGKLYQGVQKDVHFNISSPFVSPAQLVKNLRESPAAKPMRDFLFTNLDGVWVS